MGLLFLPETLSCNLKWYTDFIYLSQVGEEIFLYWPHLFKMQPCYICFVCLWLFVFWSLFLESFSKIFSKNVSPNPLTTIYGTVCEETTLLKCDINCTAFTSLLARWLILLNWKQASHPTFKQWARDVLQFLSLEKIRLYLAQSSLLCGDYLIKLSFKTSYSWSGLNQCWYLFFFLFWFDVFYDVHNIVCYVFSVWVLFFYFFACLFFPSLYTCSIASCVSMWGNTVRFTFTNMWLGRIKNCTAASH